MEGAERKAGLGPGVCFLTASFGQALLQGTVVELYFEKQVKVGWGGLDS